MSETFRTKRYPQCDSVELPKGHYCRGGWHLRPATETAHATAYKRCPKAVLADIEETTGAKLPPEPQEEPRQDQGDLFE